MRASLGRGRSAPLCATPRRHAHACRAWPSSHEPLPPPAAARGAAPKKLRFPTAFTVLAGVLLLVWVASFFVPAGAYEIDPEDGRARCPAPTTSCPSCSQRAGRRAVRRDELRPAAQAALDRAAERPLRGRERPRLRERRRGRAFLYGSAMIFLFVLAVGAFITVTMKTGAIQTGHRAARAALPPQRLGADRDPDGRLRARRDELRDVGGDARLLRPARPAHARARLRPHGRRLDHLPRRRHRRAVLDGQPVRDRRRLRRRGHQPRRRASALRIAMWVVLVALAIGYVAPLRAPRRRRPEPLDRRHLADRRARTRAA